MENPEEVLQSLDDFVKVKPKDIPKELEDYLAYVAKTGDPVYQWSLVKCLFREKLLNVITEFYEGCPSVDLPPCPNVDSFNYEMMKNSLLERLESFVSAPFTVQRLCELLTSPKKQYSRADKFMRAVEKNILVVSTREPGNNRRSDLSQTELVNGVAEGPPVQLNETVETDNSEGMNLMQDSASLDAASTEAKCSHTVDPAAEVSHKTIPEWMNDPGLTDANRPSVSERVAMIEKADATVTSAEPASEFHSRFSEPVTSAGLLEDEDDEDFVPSSQDDHQYFPADKLKTSAVTLPDFVDVPSPDSSETSAAVSAISEDSSVDATSLDNVPETSATEASSPAFVDSSPRDEVSTTVVVEEVEAPVVEDSSPEPASAPVDSSVPDIPDSVPVIETPAEPAVIVESVITEELDAEATTQETEPAPEAPEPVVEEPVKAVEEEKLAEVMPEEIIPEPVHVETSSEERDREMMVQNERVESVIQGTGDQEPVAQSVFLPVETPMEEMEPEAMEVDETSQSDEPMEQGDASPKLS